MANDIGLADDIDFLRDNDFPRLAQRRAYLQDVRDKVEDELKTLNKELEALMMAAQIKSVEFEGRIYTQKSGKSADRLSKELLLGNGVAANVIAASTIPGTPWTTILVTRKKTGDAGTDAA